MAAAATIGTVVVVVDGAVGVVSGDETGTAGAGVGSSGAGDDTGSMPRVTTVASVTGRLVGDGVAGSPRTASQAAAVTTTSTERP